MVHYVKKIRPAEQAEEGFSQLWPISILLLIMSGVIGGLIVAKGNFREPNLLYNAWTWLFALGLTVAALLWGSIRLRGKLLVRLQASVLMSLLLHLLMLMTFSTIYVAAYVAPAKNTGDKLVEDRREVTLPDYGRPVHMSQEEPERELDKPVETPTPEKQEQQVQRDPVKSPDKPVEKPVVEPPKQSESTQPTEVRMQRSETSAPRQSESFSGAKLSRQDLKLPDPTAQHVPTPSVEPTKAQPARAPSESTSTSVARESAQPQAQQRPTQSNEPASPKTETTFELKRQPSRNQPTPDSASTQLTRSQTQPVMQRPDAASPQTSETAPPTPKRAPSELKPVEATVQRQDTAQPTASKTPVESPRQTPTTTTTQQTARTESRNEPRETQTPVAQATPARPTVSPQAATTAASNPAPATTAKPSTDTAQPASTQVTRTAAASVQASKSSDTPNQLPASTPSNTPATSTQRAVAAQATAINSTAQSSQAPALTRSQSAPAPTAVAAAAEGASAAAPSRAKAQPLEASPGAAANARTAQAAPSATRSTTPAPTSADTATASTQAAAARASTARTQETAPQATAVASGAIARANASAAPSANASADAPSVAATSAPSRAAPAGATGPSATDVARTQASALPAASGAANAATQAAAAGSTATTQSANVARAARASTPSAAAQSPSPSSVARAQGAAVPSNSAAAQADAPAVASAAKSNQTSAEANPTAVARVTGGTGGQTAERNFAQDMAAGAASNAATASTAAQRTASQRDPAAGAASPSQTAQVARSTAGSDAPRAALQANDDVRLADSAGARQTSDLEASSSAASRTAASQAPAGKVQASAGDGNVDLAAAQTVASVGQARGASSQGGGPPSLAQNEAPAAPGRPTPAGEPTAATAAVAGDFASSPGANSQAVPAPAIDSQTASATRQASAVPQPGAPGGAAAQVPAAAASGAAVAAAPGQATRAEKLPGEAGGAASPLARTTGQAVGADLPNAQAEFTAPTAGASGLAGQAGPQQDAATGQLARSGQGAAEISRGSSAENAPAAGSAAGQTATAAARSNGSSSEPAASSDSSSGAPNLARASTSGGAPGAAQVAEETGPAAKSGATQVANVDAAASGLTRQASPNSAPTGSPGVTGTAPALAGAENPAGGVPASAARGERDPGGAPAGTGGTAVVRAERGDPTQGAVQATADAGQPVGAVGAASGPRPVEASGSAIERLSGAPGSPVSRPDGNTAGSPGAETPGSEQVAGGAGPRSTSRQDDAALALSGDGNKSGGPIRKQGDANLPTGNYAVDDAGYAALVSGPQAGDGLSAAPGTDAPTRQASGLPVQVAAVQGPGGLASDPSLAVGLPDPRAKRNSEVVHQLNARFVLERSAGRPAIDSKALAEVAPTFILRKEARPEAAQLFGSTPEAEKAVEAALDFLARHQSPDGSWSLDNFGAGQPGYENYGRGNTRSDSAGTGLALLAFLGAGYDHREGKYKITVQRGLDWLVKHQKDDGDLYSGTGSKPEISLYSHGIAAIPLCEAYGMTNDPDLREPARKALTFITNSQDKRGGWRYVPKQWSDTSVTGWQVMALKSGELSGFVVPKTAYEGVTKWLDFASSGPGGSPSRYAYLPIEGDRTRLPNLDSWRAVTPVMTAEALLMRRYLGWDHNNAHMKDGAEYLMQHLPPRSMHEKDLRNAYYWYYGTQVMYQMQGKYWKAWNDRLRPLLVDSQEKSGPMAGSWDPLKPFPDRWAPQGGRIYVTCLHVLMLEVYYRHLPLFELGEGKDGSIEVKTPAR